MIKWRRILWTGHVEHMGQKKNACKILVGNPKGKRPLAKGRRRWEDNIKMDLREVGWGWYGLDLSSSG
jgi:hypothetical protein